MQLSHRVDRIAAARMAAEVAIGEIRLAIACGNPRRRAFDDFGGAWRDCTGVRHSRMAPETVQAGASCCSLHRDLFHFRPGSDADFASDRAIPDPSALWSGPRPCRTLPYVERRVERVPATSL